MQDIRRILIDVEIDQQEYGPNHAKKGGDLRLEIAKITGKAHAHVMRDIRNVLEEA